MILSACLQAEAQTDYSHIQGMASTYGLGDNTHGHETANGDRFDRNKLTAASRDLPFGTIVRVTMFDRRIGFVANYGKTVDVLINDRGPWYDTHNRIIDLSTEAAKRIGINNNVARVDLKIVRRGYPPKKKKVLDAKR